MYDGLIKRLCCSKYGSCPDCPMLYTDEVEPHLLRERCAAIDAADAIAEMQKSLDGVSADNDSLCKRIDDLQKRAPKAPHGRLGDLDDFAKRMKSFVEKAENDEFDLGAVWYSTFVRLIELTPTVIEAEEGE